MDALLRHHRKNPPGPACYLLAVGIVLAMLVVRLVALPADAGLGYMTFYPGIAITVLLCGVGPGLLYLVLAAAAGVFVFEAPFWEIKDLNFILPRAGLFALTAMAILLVIDFFQRQVRIQARTLEEEIAERREAEAALADSRARLASVIDTAMDAVVSIDADQRILLFNAAAEEVFGCPAGDAVGSSMERFIPERFRPAHADHLQRFAATGLSRRKKGLAEEFDFHGLRSDGSEFPFEGSISQDTVGGKKIFTIMLRDTSERRQVRAALSSVQEELAANLDAMSRLQAIGARFVREGGLPAVLDEVVEAAIAITRADMGTIQLLDPATGNLDIVAQRGFEQPFLDFWHKVAEGQGSCGTALRAGGRVIFEDVANSPVYVGTPAEAVQRAAGVGAVQSTPLVSSSGLLLGMLSTHYHLPTRPDERALQRLDLLVVHAADIIERAQAEEALKESEERLRQSQADLKRAQAVGHIGNWRLDLARKDQVWSAETYRIFGIPEGTPVNYETFLAAVHPDDRSYVDRKWNASVHGEPCDFEHRIVVGGDIRWVREKAELEFDQRWRLVGGFGITQDITELKLARLALTKSEERFRAFMNHSPMASWIVDGEGRFQYVSPVYYETFGADGGDLAGKLISDVYPEELADRYLRDNRNNIAAWKSVESIQPGLRADGSAGEFLVIKFPIRNAANQPLICGLALDITERRQAEAQLRAFNERLAGLAAERAAHLRELAGELTQAEQRERDRLYALLHDDMQPLLVAARFGLAGLSERSSPESCLRIAGEAREHITRVLHAARTLSVQLNPPLVREQGLGPALHSLGRWVQANHGLQVDLHCAEEAEPGDAAIRLLCFNAVRELLMNAAKHAGTNRVRLDLKLDTPETLRITVADGGAGFDPASIGVGTGLSDIERRLGMIGGRLEMLSAPGAGTTATLLAPVGVAAALEKQNFVGNIG